MTTKQQPKRVALYTRVSRKSQTTENQERELRKVAEQRGWNIVKTYTDHGISGAKGRDKRPAFDQLCKDATRGEFDIVMAWALDRLGRSLLNVLQFITDLTAQGVGLYLHQQAIDSTTPTGKAMLAMAGVFAEFERDMIRERIHAGLDRAKAQGKRLGRSPVSSTVEGRVLALRKEGHGILKIATLAGCGSSTVQRILAENAAKA